MKGNLVCGSQHDQQEQSSVKAQTHLKEDIRAPLHTASSGARAIVL